jgi:purine-binding chemotaxis protein CheW
VTITETRPNGARPVSPAPVLRPISAVPEQGGNLADASEAIYGVFTVGEAQVALPLSELREVIPCPTTFSQLPASALGLVGVVNLRHLVIPVLDLRQLVGMDATGGSDVIVIVARDERVFGLLADEIRGVSRVPADALMEMAVGGQTQPVFSSSFEQPEDGSVVSVLDFTAIASMPGVPVVHDTGPRPQSALAAVAGGDDTGDVDYIRTGDASRRTVMLLRCGEIGLSIDVNHVYSVIPKLVVKPSPLIGAECKGVVPLNGRAVPVIDPMMVMGLGSLTTNDALRGIVLSMPRGLVVLAVNDVTNIESVPAEDVLPLPSSGMTASQFIMGALLIPGKGQYLVLNGETLRADDHLDDFAGLGMPLEGTEDAVTAGAGRRRPEPAEGEQPPEGRRVEPNVQKYLTYNAGIDVATPLVQISEILPYPTDYIPLENGGTTQGVFTHRRATVPLVHLTTLLGRYESVDRASARVLLVDAPGGYVGFIVPTLKQIEESIWLEVEQPEDDYATSTPSKRLVKVGTPEQGRMLPYIDLSKLAARV